MIGIEQATLQLRRPRANLLDYACLLSRNTFSPLHDSTNDDSDKERCKKNLAWFSFALKAKLKMSKYQDFTCLALYTQSR